MTRTLVLSAAVVALAAAPAAAQTQFGVKFTVGYAFR